MNGGWWYRHLGIGGTLALVVGAVVFANQPAVQSSVAVLPVIGSLGVDTATGSELVFEAGTTAIVVSVLLIPLFKPRPRRILDIWMEGLRRTALGILAMATIGYFDYTYRLPRLTLIVTGGLLLLALPAYFVVIRRRPHRSGDRTLIIGDNPALMGDILDAVEGNVIGYVSPPSPSVPNGEVGKSIPRYADGGAAYELDELANLGGLLRLDEVLVENDISRAILAFNRTDRSEFFGTLDTCYDYGVRAMAHRDHADAVLTSGQAAGDLVEIHLEPWDWQDYLFKRIFDITFAGIGLVLLSPVILVIAAAVKLDDHGPILYSQERTAEFGVPFDVLKFRTMRVGRANPIPLEDEENPRITKVGCFLRKTHIDEIPQLWSILVGDMSVVGPRAVWTNEEGYLEPTASDWRKRWFVKPGLTGLAQIHGVSSTEPQTKLRYDIEYIRRQSFWFDMKIIVRQVWQVIQDLYGVRRWS